ncbi:acetolactate synthase 1 catalytic subunit [Streptomyces sp. CB02058]|nr:acetolactate synthase large subunit [Streptomyces sp. CB02058]OKI92891.1 acetolactate synthase 1 catalytic subunit [Streptomyces sp. CB02058]
MPEHATEHRTVQSIPPATAHAPAATPPAAPPVGASEGDPVTGAQSLIRSLEVCGAEVVFGIPGGAILPAYDPMLDSRSLRHILVRHEQGAGHAATGYAQATGRVGVCMATSGPGATNLVTPLLDAYMDSVPLVAITGQVESGLIGTDAFQEADIVGITMPVTKHGFHVTDADEIPRVISEAFRLASSGRPGPVLVDITKDALQADTVFVPPAPWEPASPPLSRAHGKQVRAAARLITGCKRPVLYVGGGVVKAGATAELSELAELTGAPVTTTLMALDAFPGGHRQHLGMPGMHGSVPAVAALQKADLIVALGARFDDRVTGRPDTFAPHAKVVHVDIDAAEIGKNRAADVSIVSDARTAIADLARAVRHLRAEGETGAAAESRYTGWWRELDRCRASYPLTYDRPADGRLAPQHVIERIGQLAPQGTVFTAGVGQHQMWAAHFLPHGKPRTWLNSGGAGTMGYAVPAAMGAKVARPGSTVWAVDGDGCFQMTCQELTTCALNGIPIKVAVINNGALGMVRQLQNMFYDRRHSASTLHSAPGRERPGQAPAGTRVPDFVELAEALGCAALRCESADDLDDTIRRANAIDDRPVVVDFIVEEDAMVWPMVPAGASNDAIMTALDLRPDFGQPDD